VDIWYHFSPKASLVWKEAGPKSIFIVRPFKINKNYIRLYENKVK